MMSEAEDGKAQTKLTEDLEEDLVEEVITSSHNSSSTEGPDSPAHSTSSSPLNVMIPAYPDNPADYGLEDDEDRPLLPLFTVKFSDEASKDGDVVRYKIKVKKLSSSGSDEQLTIEREYDDFEYLHHVLTTHNQVITTIFSSNRIFR